MMSSRSPTRSPCSSSTSSATPAASTPSDPSELNHQKTRRRTTLTDGADPLSPSDPPWSPSSIASSSLSLANRATSTSSTHPPSHTQGSHGATILSPALSNSRSPSPSPATRMRLGRSRMRTTQRLFLLVLLLLTLLTVGNMYIGGFLNLESLHQAVQYLRESNNVGNDNSGIYHLRQQQPHLANSLLYLLTFLLLVSFWVLGSFIHPIIQLVGLPFHLLIGTALSRLLPELAVWCGGCYVLLGIVIPYGARILARAGELVHVLKEFCPLRKIPTGSRATAGSMDSSKEGSPLLPILSDASSSSVSKLSTDTGETGVGHEQQSCNTRISWTRLQQLRQSLWTLVTLLYSQIVSMLIFLSGASIQAPSAYSLLQQVSAPNASASSSAASVSPSLPQPFSSQLITRRAAAARWYRLMIASGLWGWMVLSLWHNNELRNFDPSHAARSFRMHPPEPICSGWELKGYHGRLTSLDEYWQDYSTLHQRVILLGENVANGRLTPLSASAAPSDRLPQTLQQTRFLIFRPGEHDNLGQRLQGLVSAMVLAMMTRRAFIIDWSPMASLEVSLEDLFQMPEGINWQFNSTSFSVIRNSELYAKRTRVWLPYCRDCALRSPLSESSPWSHLLCSPSFGLDVHQPVIEISSAQWFLPVLQHNVFWRGEICSMFSGGGHDAFGRLAAKLLRPSAKVQSLVDGVLARVPADGTLVGLQIEAEATTTPSASSPFGALALKSNVIEDAFLKCASMAIAEEKARRNVVKQEKAQASDLGNSGNTNNQSEQESKRASPLSLLPRQQQQQEQQKVWYFLSTDSAWSREILRNKLGDRLLLLDWFSSPSTSSSSLPPSSSFSNDQSSQPLSADDATHAAQVTVAEMWILSRAKRLIATPASSQGEVAHALGNLLPDFVTPDLQCRRRATSTQPCFHYWFAYALRGAACSVRATEEMSDDYHCWS